jgi:HSP20 family protein
MNITNVNPFLPGRTFSNMMDDVFNNSISNLVGSDLEVTMPATNIIENNENYILMLAAPGLEKQDFDVSLEKGMLIISGNKNNGQEEKETEKWIRKEFNFSSFRRSFKLTDVVDFEHIQAEYTNGILVLTLPKKEEVKTKAPRSIEIK